LTSAANCSGEKQLIPDKANRPMMNCAFTLGG
jgi:hypothetical protein